MNDPSVRDKPNTQPLKLSDGIDEKRAPIVHPIARPEPYPINIPPPIPCKYLIGVGGMRNLNSPEAV